MTLVLALTALRQHVLSAACSAVTLAIFASLFRVPVPLALAAWTAASLLALDIWRRYEPPLLRHLACREPSHLERDRLTPALTAALEAATHGIGDPGARSESPDGTSAAESAPSDRAENPNRTRAQSATRAPVGDPGGMSAQSVPSRGGEKPFGTRARCATSARSGDPDGTSVTDGDRARGEELAGTERNGRARDAHRAAGGCARERAAPDVEVLVLDVAEPWLGVGLRTLVVTRALLDLLDDRALVGALAQAVAQMRSANLPGELVVWLGCLPLVGAWCISRWLVALARLLAVVVGASLVVPLLFCAEGFTRWAGRAFGAVGVALLGASLLSSGLAGAGVSLLLGWAMVPGLAALLDRDRRRAELAADAATVAAGLGWQLVEALETLAWTASSPTPAGPLGPLCQKATPITNRADRIWQALAEA